MSSLPEILAAAQSLPTSEQVQLIHALWDSLPPEEWTAPTDVWIAEANRRSDALDTGQITAEPWSQVRVRVRKQAGLDG
jgi:putative addiction module component (TIGR02574 family)